MRGLRLLFLCIILFLFGTSSIKAQQSSGTIIGHIAGDSTTSNAVVEVIEVTTSTKIQDIPVNKGSFTAQDVPFGTYILRMRKGGEVVSSRVVVNSSVPVETTLAKEIQREEVVVEADRLDESRIGPHTVFTANTVELLPTTTTDKAIEAVLLNTPGIVPDEDGRMHMRGEDAQLQYIIDGIPLIFNQTRVYSSLFNANLIKTIDILRGGLNPEYGVATSGIVTITTKSGFDHPWFGNASQRFGTFNTKETEADFGGNFNGTVGIYGAYSTSNTNRYLDPINGFDPIHDDGSSSHYFGKVDVLASEALDIEVLGGFNKTKYAIPNSGRNYPGFGVKEQDQRQTVDDYTIGARAGYSLSPTSVLSLSAYQRHQTAEATSGGLSRLDMTDTTMVTKAIRENEKFFIGANRTLEATGGQLELSLRPTWGETEHNLKFGVGGEVYPIKEYFTFAVTNPDLSNRDSAGGDDRFLPYDITKSGQPFLVDTEKTGKRYSAYAQDQFKTGKWTLAGGVRFDLFDLFDQEVGISPRLGATYSVSDDLLLRASYNRIIMQAPLENILVSSSSQARQLTGADQGTTPTQVGSENAHVFELGAGYKLNNYLDFDLAGYGKLIDDFIVKVELGNSGIIFPVNLKQGVVAGGELQMRLHNWNKFNANLSVSTCVSKGVVPDDGSSPIAAGLILGEEGEFYGHPWSGEDMFNTEHNQLLTSAFTITYDIIPGFSATLGGRFDSGLPFDLADENGTGLSTEASRTELLRRGYTQDVIDLLELQSEAPGSPDKSVAPHATFDLGVSLDLQRIGILPAYLRGTIINIFDTPYLYKFESAFGGTHFGQPRMFFLEILAHS